MAVNFDIVSPVDNSVYATCRYAERETIMAAAERARAAIRDWKNTPFDDRAGLVLRLLEAVRARKDQLAVHVTWQMGRPLWQADETARLLQNAAVMIEDARVLLAPQPVRQDADIRRMIELEPLGLCLSICAWNYPVAMASSLLTAPLLMGNVVIMKHSPQTALVAELFAEAAAEAGLPEGVFQALHMQHGDAEALIGSGLVDMVQFIGSTRGGQAVYDAGRGTFTRFGLELGGKDPLYLRHDAPLDLIMDDLIEGCFGNAGQSCCSVERIYVHRDIYREFLDRFTAAAAQVTIGHPVEDKSYIGPVVSVAAAERIGGLVEDALAKGAKAALPAPQSPLVRPGSAYVAPQVLLDADHSMAIMREETFGPVVPVMAVPDDETAVSLMNDTDYGLTASIWSTDQERALALGRQLETGVFYVNRCDHADMFLPWGGMRRSGIGRSYAVQGLADLVTPRGYHLRSLSPRQ